eukprot:CAMPEP_0180575408 /NCGR_PEP_ID=MMETSP1037_2-20121125/10870_1 /TAXON_ID=632150 /ORGANISM="Azadinium spinosum, Strain 3D9" /LENGTH=57 /DNA_ID=CAMNT_0022593057 /DNA_START=57 /DNA_END=227 /DNA_ORIENTATION=+
MDGREVSVPEEREARQAEECVEDIGHIARPVCDASILVILRLVDEGSEFGAVDPMRP